MTTKRIVCLPGDGIGPEIMDAAKQVLRALGGEGRFIIEDHLIGGAAIDATGARLPVATRAACLAADAVLLGAVGGPKWAGLGRDKSPEFGLLDLRKALGVFANVRPVASHPATRAHAPLKPERLVGVDFVVMRELTGGIYFGKKSREATRAIDECVYEVHEIERIARKAGHLARGRRSTVTSVDKANVLETSRLWREVTSQVFADEFPDVALEHLLVDAAAMHLLSRPADFDVILTENMFGDILTDEASMLAGSIGLLASASLGDSGPGLYEPIHGSAPDIAGQGIANPVGMLRSVALMLDLSLEMPQLANSLEAAIDQTLDDGIVTGDLGGTARTGEVTAAVVQKLHG